MRTDATPEEVKIFFEELEEQTQAFERGLLRLEKEPENAELLSEIFRCAHTLKGSSFTLGYSTIGSLTHSMENLLDKLRNKEMSLNSDIANVLLEGLDTLKLLKFHLESGDEKEIDIQDFAEKITRLCDDKNESIHPTPLLSDESEDAFIENRETKPYRISIEISSQCEEPAMRVSQIFSYLQDMGEIYKSVPTLEEVENENVGQFVELVFLSEKKKEDIDEILSIVPGLEKINVAALQNHEFERQEKTVIDAVKVTEKKEDARKELKEEITPGEKAPSQISVAPAQSVRIDVARLDALMDLLGELVIDRTRLSQLGMDLENKYEGDTTVVSINQTFEHLDRITSEMHEQFMKTRLLPVEIIFNKFPRMLRDLSMKSGKKVSLQIQGAETELDRQIIDQIADPLTHILRNALDHGIEPPAERKKKGKPEEGTIVLSARHEEGHIVITVTDDGKGMALEKIKEKAIGTGLLSKSVVEKLTDAEVLNLVFLPGFSTRETAGEVSGRGVGMDIVKTNIEKLNGSIAVETQTNKGTTLTLKLPLTLAIVKSLLVTLSENILAFPLFSVTEALWIARAEIKTVRKKETIQLRGEVLPLVYLSEIFRFGKANKSEDNFWIVVVSWADKKAGILVDSLIGDQDIVIKPLSPLIKRVDGVLGTAVLGSGDVALIMDIPGILKCAAEEAHAG